MRSRSMLWPLVAGTASSCCQLPGEAGPAAARAARSFTIPCTSTVTAAAAHVSLSRRPAGGKQARELMMGQQVKARHVPCSVLHAGMKTAWSSTVLQHHNTRGRRLALQ